MKNQNYDKILNQNENVSIFNPKKEKKTKENQYFQFKIVCLKNYIDIFNIKHEIKNHPSYGIVLMDSILL